MFLRSLAFILAIAPAGWAHAASSKFVEPVLLLDYGRGSTDYDYRPTVNAEGTHVVYEHTETAANGARVGPFLYMADLRLRQPYKLPNLPAGAARANWCWHHGQTTDGKIAFSADGSTLYLVDPFDNKPAQALPASPHLFYPAWSPTCGSLVAEHSIGTTQTTAAERGSVRYDLATQTTGERLLSGRFTMAGFVDVNKAAPNLLVFAGQAVGSGSYDENFNYVYVSDTSVIPPKVRPLDQQAPQNYSGRYQGRAPTWSTDGQWVVFESNRACQNANLYALFLQDGMGATPARQVTDCAYNAQHGRFMPKTPGSAATIVITAVALHPECNERGRYTRACADIPHYAEANGVAAVNVTGLLQPSP